jgi:hypothetical protein
MPRVAFEPTIPASKRSKTVHALARPLGYRDRPTSPLYQLEKPSIQWVPGALLPGVKRHGREAHHPPPTSAEVKKMWIYASTSL